MNDLLKSLNTMLVRNQTLNVGETYIKNFKYSFQFILLSMNKQVRHWRSIVTGLAFTL